MSRLQNLHNFLFKLSIQDVIIFVLVILGLTLITKLIKGLAKFITKKFPKKRMAIFGWVPLINFIIYLMGIVAASFIIFQPTKEVYIGFLASMLLALGFAAKDMAASVIAGIVLLLDKPFQVGDRVTFHDSYGEIITMGLLSVKLLTLDEDIVTIPNQRLMTDTVSSSSAGELGMMTTVDLHIPPNADLLQAKEILENVTRTISYVNLDKKIVVVAKEVLGIAGVVSITMKTKCIIKDARTERAFQTEFLMLTNKEFKKHGITQNAN